MLKEYYYFKKSGPAEILTSHMEEKTEIVAQKRHYLRKFLLLASMGLLRFELKSITPEATRIPSYPTGPVKIENKKSIKIICYLFKFTKQFSKLSIFFFKNF